jgi:hypothetical protein
VGVIKLTCIAEQTCRRSTSALSAAAAAAAAMRAAFMLLPLPALVTLHCRLPVMPVAPSCNPNHETITREAIALHYTSAIC